MRADSIFILLDAARMHGEIYRAQQLNPEHTCLYEGDSARFLSAVAPWLFKLEPGSDFARWLSEHGSGQSWGVVLRCGEDPVKLYKHLRNFLIVQGEDGREMYFRYYDPRVLRAFLPTCEPEQLRALFGPIQVFVAEDADGQVVEYSLDEQGALHVDPTGRTLGKFLHDVENIIDRRQADPVQEVKGTWDFGY